MVTEQDIPTFLKWAGGKRRLISSLEKHFPKEINNYFEPFLGGGFVFFFIKKNYAPKTCTISDINKDLIATYIGVRDNPKELIHKLISFKRKHSEKFYYSVREKFNNNEYDRITRSAAFIYLNKTCYNGLYRVNSQNKFNVPFGRYVNPEIFNEETILEASRLLQGVNIILQDYRKIIRFIHENDFIYLDPCYDPIKKTSFVSYTPDKFTVRDRIELAKFIDKVNNDIREVRDLYKTFSMHKIRASRSINSVASNRGKIVELVITNV
jgi:DNA adenine methylase